MTCRLGYACINTVLQEAPPKQRKIVNKSCIAKTFREKGVEYAKQLATSNLKTVLDVLKWNEKNGIRLYRLSSDMFPHLTNKEFKQAGKMYSYDLDEFDPLFKKIGEYALKHGHRLTFHPGQFNQIGTPVESVFENTIRDLSAQAEILDRIGVVDDAVMVIHGGGSYGDKKATMARWIDQFHQLPVTVQKKIVIENCERQYNWKNVLHLSHNVKRPVIFDTHHHNCYSLVVNEQPDPSTFIHDIVDTWRQANQTPKFHISEQAPDKRIGAHSDFVESIPAYLLNLVDNDCLNIDIMIEAKRKEQAVLKLYEIYFHFENGLWS